MVDAPDDMIVHYDDAKLAGHCPSGVRRWFEAHDLDFRDFLDNGIKVGELRGIDDALWQRVVDLKLAREDARGR